MADTRKSLTVLESVFPFVFFTESFFNPNDFLNAKIEFFHNRFGRPDKPGEHSSTSELSLEQFLKKIFADQNQLGLFLEGIQSKGEIQELEVLLNEDCSLLKRCHISSKIIRLQKGEFYLQGHFLGLPQRLKELEKSLHEENKMLETILSGIGDAVCVYDTQCHMIFQSRLHTEWFPEPAGYMCFNRNHSNNGFPVQFEPETFIENRKNGKGKNQCLEITIHPIKNESGKIFAGINIVRDLSLNLELEAKSRELEEFKQNQLLLSTRKKIIGESRPINKVLEAVNKICKLDTVVFIQGETGTGKELIARAVHNLSPRAHKPFVALNCGALSETLLDSELFGHTRGAFTGAETETPGLFDAADGGTIFLDEIGEMSLGTQVKLLRVLQDGEKRKLGSTKTQKVNVRVITATHRNIESLVSENKFRADLFYRIHVFTIYSPPLRDREDDIFLLTDFFLKEFSSAQNKNVRKISKEAALLLKEHSWPGNVRELRNIIERATILCESDTLGVQDLPLTIQKSPKEIQNKGHYSNFLEENLQEITKKKIVSCLEQNRWNKTITAKALNISRATLWRRIKEYSIPSS